jgi:hypothetical protein
MAKNSKEAKVIRRFAGSLKFSTEPLLIIVDGSDIF